MSTSDSTPTGSLVPDALGSIVDGIDHPLDPQYVTLQRKLGWIGAVVTSLMMLPAALVIIFAVPLSTVFSRLLLAVWFAGSVANAWWQQKRPALEYRYTSYCVDAGGICIRRGIFWRTVISVPRSRVQHTEVSQGPLERKYGLGTLTIHTAGVNHAMVSLTGLSFERAQQIRDFLLPRDRGNAD